VHSTAHRIRSAIAVEIANRKLTYYCALFDALAGACCIS